MAVQRFMLLHRDLEKIPPMCHTSTEIGRNCLQMGALTNPNSHEGQPQPHYLLQKLGIARPETTNLGHRHLGCFQDCSVYPPSWDRHRLKPQRTPGTWWRESCRPRTA
ncbi:Hypothetical predicted protein [Pelobates cultripes]|uniref:Uncharacterized protein n=1 Tax=Pelobates cultripes TaxID=61616 RepID=A0AAD1WKV1_PELCU|nr:Hypothetical predicted protein [Pelobates cultripes]